MNSLERWERNHGMTLEQYRALSQANRFRVLRKEPIDESEIKKSCPVHGKEAIEKRKAEHSARVKAHIEAKAKQPKYGVGWHLKQLLEGITVEGCSCKSVATMADRLGIEVIGWAIRSKIVIGKSTGIEITMAHMIT